MNTQKLKLYISFALYSIVCFMVMILQSTGLMTFRISTASAVLILPLVVYSGFYFGEYCGAVLGLLAGAVTDAYSSTFIYNTVALTACGFIAGLVISRLFNRNLAAACVMNTTASVLYFFIKWLTVYAFSDPEPMFVFLRFTLPSGLYTAVVGILMYFLLNLFLKKIPINPTKR